MAWVLIYWYTSIIHQAASWRTRWRRSFEIFIHKLQALHKDRYPDDRTRYAHIQLLMTEKFVGDLQKQANRVVLRQQRWGRFGSGSRSAISNTKKKNQHDRSRDLHSTYCWDSLCDVGKGGQGIINYLIERIIWTVHSKGMKCARTKCKYINNSGPGKLFQKGAR